MATTKELGSHAYIVRFYREQLRVLDKIGLGNYTEYGVKVTQRLIDITRKRLDQLVIKGVRL